MMGAVNNWLDLAYLMPIAVFLGVGALALIWIQLEREFTGWTISPGR